MYVDKDFVIGTFLGKSTEIMLHRKTRRMFSGKISWSPKKCNMQ